jgi:sugar lactone lactonase YvrE
MLAAMQTQHIAFVALTGFALAGGACAASQHASLPSRPATATLALPGATYYPESVTVAADGALYISSLGGAGVVRIAAASTTAETFVAGTGKNIAGVYADDDAQLVYVCENQLTASPAVAPRLIAYRMADGAQAKVYAFPQPGVCNDMVLDGAHNLYVTDSAGRVYVLRSGAAELAVFSADPQLASAMPGGFGADGIVWDGDGTLYVNLFSDSTLLRIAIKADGTAGAVAPITVTPALQNPDGMRALDAHTLVLAEGAGRITQLAITGDAATGTVVASGLDSPTSLAVTQGAYFVTEGQLGHFLGLVAGPPSLPFATRRVATK